MTDTSAGVSGAVLELRQPGRWLNLGIYAVIVAMWTLVELLPGGDLPEWDRAIQGGCAVLLVVSLVLQILAGVWAEAAGVRSRDQLGRRRQLDWPQVHHFELRGGWRGLGAVTLDGRWVRLMQYGIYDRRAAEYVMRLEAYRWQRQQALGLA